MPSLSGNAAHLILLQAPAAASGRSSSGAGGWARGWHSRPVEPKLVEQVCMLVRRWAPPLEEEMRVLPATAGSSSLCQILLLYPSFLRACISHLTIAPTRTMVHAGGSLDAVQVPASTDRGGV